MKHYQKILIYGYGNPGRQDDGLGPMVAASIEKRADEFPDVEWDSNYQLNIEDAMNIRDYDAVIFADASLDCHEPFELYRLQPAKEITFTTHAMSAESVLALGQDIYGENPECYMLAIRGYEWEMGYEKLSDRAAANLDMALDFLVSLLTDDSPNAFADAIEASKVIKI